MKTIQLSTIAVTALLSSQLFGANIPSSSDILRQVEPPKFQKEETTIPSVQLPVYKAPMKLDNKIKIGVKSFKITNNSVISSEEIILLIKDYENKELSLNDLNNITEIITKYYRDKGYFVAKAYLPVQELSKTDAIVEISIIEGHYGEMKNSNDSYVNKETILGFMNKLNNEVISSSNLERQMMLVDELGGVKVVNAQIQTGKNVGTSDFLITTQQDSRYDGSIIADNYGSRYTGEYRLNAIGNISSLNGYGDLLTANVMSSNTGNLLNTKVNYKMPIGYDGLNFNTSLSYTKYKIGKEFENLDIRGNSITFDTGLSYALIKSRTHTLETSLTYTNVNITDENNYQDDKKKDINSLKLSFDDTLKTSLMDKAGTLSSSVSLILGDVNLNSYAESIDALNSNGYYSKVEIFISQTQPLIQKLSLITTLSGQISLDKNLDGNEDFSSGGASGVRAYTSSELSGDKGYLGSLELNYNLPILNGVRHSLSTFIDHSKVWDNTNSVLGVSPESRELNDIGLGYNLDYKKFNLKSTYAHGFGANSTPTGDGDNTNLNRIFVQAMMKF